MKVAAQKQMVKKQSQAENGAIRLQVSGLQYYCSQEAHTWHTPITTNIIYLIIIHLNHTRWLKAEA